VQGFLSEGDYTAIQHDLQQRGFSDFAQSNMEIVGPGTTLDQFLSENEKWNKASKEYGCVTSAPAPTFPNHESKGCVMVPLDFVFQKRIKPSIQCMYNKISMKKEIS